jgi:uncharacterized membrane protein YkvA (DUF1232 family)
MGAEYSRASAADAPPRSSPASEALAPAAPPKRRRGLSAVPFVGDLLAMTRLFRDRDASLLSKLLVVATIAYVVFPLDAVPDAIPILGWLDDVGIVVGVRLALHRALGRYRYPLFGAKPDGAPLLTREKTPSLPGT